MQVHDEACAVPTTATMKMFKRVKLRGKKKLGWATFKIDKKTKEIVPDKNSSEVEGSNPADALRSILPPFQPRYCIFDYEFKKKDGRLASELHFFSYMPPTAGSEDRVVYATAAKAFQNKLSGTIYSKFGTVAEMSTRLGGTRNESESEDSESEEDFD